MGKDIGLGILALFTAVFFAATRLGKRKTRQLKKLAAAMGFSFADEDEAMLKSLGHLNLFRQSGNQEAWNIMRGTVHGVVVTILDHRGLSGPAGSSSRQKVSAQTVIIFQSDLLHLPGFILRPKDLAHRISTVVLGYQDLNFEPHPTFSRQYHLHGMEEESIRRLFGDKVLTYYEEPRRLSMDGQGDQVGFCQLNKAGAPKDVPSFIEHSHEVFRLLAAKSGGSS